MKRTHLFPALLFTVVFLIGGCPQLATESPAGTGGGTGSTSQSGSGSSQGTGNTGGQTAATGSTTSGGSVSSGLPTCTRPLDADAWRSEVLRLVNQERTGRGLGLVAWNATLESEAIAYACEMIQGGYFAHVDPQTGSTLGDRADVVAYQYWMLGENLAAGQATPAKVMDDWMNSPDHRENILNPAFTELGVGVLTGGEYRIYWVQEFGRPRSAGPYQN